MSKQGRGADADKRALFRLTGGRQDRVMVSVYPCIFLSNVGTAGKAETGAVARGYFST
jgi:hypothetical protein